MYYYYKFQYWLKCSLLTDVVSTLNQLVEKGKIADPFCIVVVPLDIDAYFFTESKAISTKLLSYLSDAKIIYEQISIEDFRLISIDEPRKRIIGSHNSYRKLIDQHQLRFS